MCPIKQYEIDGLVIDIPLVYDESSDRYFEDYPNFKEKPIYTPNGHRITVAMMDACERAEADEKAENSCLDCSECRYFKRAGEHTLLGICNNARKE